MEYYLFKIAKTKFAVIPYGGDAHVYRRLRNPYWLASLLTDYPVQARMQKQISKRVDFYVAKADIFLPGGAMFDGFGRADRVITNTLCLDTTEWECAQKIQREGLTITHSPNHRGVKGTHHIINAVKKLRLEGYPVELILLEGLENSEVKRLLQNRSDIHVDQLNSDCYGLSAIESMSLAIPTISSFDGALRDFFDEWSYSKECPIIIANSKTIYEVIKGLVEDEDERLRIGLESRNYVEKYHSYSYFEGMFEELVLERDWLINET